MRNLALIAAACIILVLASGCGGKTQEQRVTQEQVDRAALAEIGSDFNRTEPTELTDSEDSFGSAEFGAQRTVQVGLEDQDDLEIIGAQAVQDFINYVLSLLGMQATSQAGFA